MDKAMTFIDHHKEVALATISDGEPRLRVFQVMKRDKETLYFATSTKAKVYKQLRQDSRIEILSSGDNQYVRMSGRANFNIDSAIEKEIYDNNQILHTLCDDQNDIVYFKLNADEVEYYNMNVNPPQVEFEDKRKSE